MTLTTTTKIDDEREDSKEEDDQDERKDDLFVKGMSKDEPDDEEVRKRTMKGGRGQQIFVTFPRLFTLGIYAEIIRALTTS